MKNTVGAVGDPFHPHLAGIRMKQHQNFGRTVEEVFMAVASQVS
jgi:hypothetical protein